MNAFMLFMMEQRATVRASIKSKGTGAVAAHLGSVVRLLEVFASSDMVSL